MLLLHSEQLLHEKQVYKLYRLATTIDSYSVNILLRVDTKQSWITHTLCKCIPKGIISIDHVIEDKKSGQFNSQFWSDISYPGICHIRICHVDVRLQISTFQSATHEI